jgi:hypothetical protein
MNTFCLARPKANPARQGQGKAFRVADLFRSLLDDFAGANSYGIVKDGGDHGDGLWCRGRGSSII